MFLSALCSVTGDSRAQKELAKVTCADLGAGNGTRGFAFPPAFPQLSWEPGARAAAPGRTQEEAASRMPSGMQ